MSEATPQACLAGQLTLVATPLGNLADIAPRAVEVLRTADVICCEDSRRTGRLLELVGIERVDGVPRLLIANETTESDVAGEVVDLVRSGASVALVSDAGMPALADPGQTLVAAVAAAGGAVAVIPGPSAPAAALAVSGFVATPHVFVGWLPRRGAARADQLAEIADETRTVVLFESPHRLAATLGDIAQSGGAERPCVVAREISKLHEEVLRGTVGELASKLSADGSVRGEVVVVLSQQAAPELSDSEVVAEIAANLAAGASPRDAAAAAAKKLGVGRNRAYRLALATRPGTVERLPVGSDEAPKGAARGRR